MDWLFYLSIPIVFGLAFWFIPNYVGWVIAKILDGIWWASIKIIKVGREKCKKY